MNVGNNPTTVDTSEEVVGEQKRLQASVCSCNWRWSVRFESDSIAIASRS